MVDEAPRILAGRYEVGELIGRGGMAEVHIGHDTRLGRTVAIKILRSDLARDPSFQARFRREAQAAAALNHPAIVAVYDTGEDAFTDPTTAAVSHVPFIVMEYVEGHTVRDILQDGSAVPIEEAVEITQGVLAALDYSHRAGIVHRDIKPANVMLTPTGAVKVMDFGIARALADSAATMTQTQAVIGTAQYLSPEQARGETVDARSDIYSTGCLFFELLTGRPPFQGDSPVSVAYQHVREEAPAPSTIAPDVPHALDQVTAKALAKDRENRYSTAGEFRADLEAALNDRPLSAPAVPAPISAPAAAAETDATQVYGAVPANATQVMTQDGTTPPWLTTQTGQQPVSEEEEPKSRRALMWTLIAVAIAAVIAIVLVLVLSHKNEPIVPTVSMPQVTGLTQKAAKAAIADAGITSDPQVTKEPSADVDRGVVISSDPQEGETLSADDPVTLVVSSGPADVSIQDVSGLDQDQAVKLLTDQGLVVNANHEFEDSADVAKGRVTRTDPEAGSGAKEGDSVTLYISSGMVDVPDLTGKKKADAIKVLQDLKLSYNTEPQETDDVKPGRVIEQSPDAGKVEQLSQVTLTIAKKPEPKTFSLPDLAGMKESAAQDKLSDLKLTWDESEYENSDDVTSGKVIRTEPGAGDDVTEGDTVHLVISSGPSDDGGDNPPPDQGGDGGDGGDGGNNPPHGGGGGQG